MKPFDYAKEQILNFVSNDVLDFPFAYGFAAEALKEEDPRTDDILRLLYDVLFQLLDQRRIVIGDITGSAENFVPWDGSPAEVIDRLRRDVDELGIENIGDRDFVCWISDRNRLVREISH